MTQNAWKIDATGKLALTARQLQRRIFNDPVVPAVDDNGDPFLDEQGQPVQVIDPRRGHSVRSIRRNMRKLEALGLVMTGSQRFQGALGGGHHRVYQVSIPDWLLPTLFKRIEDARAAGGRKSRPKGSVSDAPHERPARTESRADEKMVAAALAIMARDTERRDRDRSAGKRAAPSFVKASLTQARAALSVEAPSTRAGP